MEARTANFRLAWGGRNLEGSVPVPVGPVRPRILLPMVQQLTNSLVGLGESLVAAQGETISCRAGCGACCRQLVPISETEAHHLRELVESLPEPRQSEVKKRFADALARLDAAGLLAGFRDLTSVPDPIALGMNYFRIGIPCPFLEAESCSIHPDRPLSCREYLVTSPREHCAHPTPETIRRVPTPGFAMTSFATLDGPPEKGSMAIRWVPLVLALQWAGEHPEPEAAQTGTELFSQFMTALTKKKIPPPINLPSAEPKEQP